MKAYLSGAMEGSVDEGAGWRNDLADWLTKTLGHGSVNPVEESRKLMEKEHAGEYRKWKTSAPHRFRTFVRKLVDQDLYAINHEVDYVICLWDSGVLKGGGTHGEVTMAYHCGKPIYLVNKLPMADLSGWIYSCSTEVFTDFRSLKQHLKDIYLDRS